MQGLGLIVGVLGVLWALSNAYFIRATVRRGGSLMPQTIMVAMLNSAGVLGVLVSGNSPLHFLWVFPCSFLVASVATVRPLSVLLIPGRIFAALCCLGLGRGWQDATPEVVAAAGLAGDLARLSSDDAEVLGRYGRALEAAYNAGGPLLPESKLPYPKDRIHRSLLNALGAIRDEEFQAAVKKSLLALDDFVPDADVPSDRERNATEWLQRRAARG